MKYQSSDFGQYGAHFQSKLLQSLLLDHKFFETIYDILIKDYFDSKPHYKVYESIQEYYEKYKLAPSIETLETIVLQEQDDMLREACIDVFREIKKSLVTDTKYIKDESIKFCRNQKMKTALYTSVNLWEQGKYDEIYKVVGEALKAGEENNTGHYYFTGLESRISKLQRYPIPTGLHHIDKQLNGGLAKGELGVIVAPPGIGKSMFLGTVGKNGIIAGKNIAHYTLELYEHQVGVRYDSMFTGLSINDIPFNKKLVQEKLDKMENVGKLIIKEYATKSATVNTIRFHLDKLLQRGIVVDEIIVDYADLLKSKRHYEQRRFEAESVYEDLRSLAGELSVPVWTACFHGDTEVKLVDGRSIKIRDAVNLSKRENLYVYSYDHENKKLTVGKVNDVFKTGINQPLYKVTLDNDKSVIATSNHNFMLRTGEYRELKDLKIGDSLMPFYEKKDKFTNRLMVYTNDGSYKLNYRFVAEWKYGKIPKLHQVHHIDHDKYNDHPDNLQIMTISEHYRQHSWFNQGTPMDIQRLKEVYSERMKKNNPMFDPEIRKRMGESRKGQCCGDENPMRRPENRKKVSKTLLSSTALAEHAKKLPEIVKNIWSNRTESEKKNIGNNIQIGRWGSSKEDRIQKHIEIANICKSKKEYLEMTKEIPLRGWDKTLIWRNKNHKVKSIEFYGYDDVYNMEVEKYHNYALSSGIIVKNSQSNRGSVHSDIVTLDFIAESFAKAGVADVILTLSRTLEDKLKGTGRIFLAKSRAGQDGVVFPITMNTANATIKDSAPITDMDQLKKELQLLDDTNQVLLKETLKNKYDDFKKNQGEQNV